MDEEAVVAAAVRPDGSRSTGANLRYENMSSAPPNEEKAEKEELEESNKDEEDGAVSGICCSGPLRERSLERSAAALAGFSSSAGGAGPTLPSSPPAGPRPHPAAGPLGFAACRPLRGALAAGGSSSSGRAVASGSGAR